uniref:TF-B3 domain-containing protein n=1 Tax=Arundo donax TaxID=35708 RepID=A0A0A9CIX3_ARUDO
MDSSCRRCEWRAEKAYKDLDDRQKYFLVPMKGDFQQAITIPGKLLERLKGEIPAQITLGTRNRNSSTIGVAKYPDKVVFSAGWATFVDTYDLHIDGSMMFRYTGDSQFHVIIFDQFGCEEPLSVLEDYACLPPRDPERHIDATGTMKCCQNCKELDEYKYHSLDNEEKYFLVSVKGDFRHEMTVPEEYARYFRGEFPGEIKLETRNGYSYPAGVAK